MINSPQSLGGQVMAKRQRRAALRAYYNDPNRCLYCNSVILVGEHERVPDVRKKKYCDKICYGDSKRKTDTDSTI